MADCYKGMPKSLRIGCYVFQVEVEEFEDSEAARTFGHMNPINQKIRVRPGMTAQNLANTFIHEVMHAIFWFQAAGHFSMREDMPMNIRDIEEEYVTKGANGLCSFWIDNPKACAWWSRLLRAEAVE